MYDMHGLRSIACGLVKSEANALFRTEYYVMRYVSYSFMPGAVE